MAQENRFSAGLEAALPMGDFGDAVGFGIGGSLGYEIPVGDNLGVLGQAGYISFAGKDYDFTFLGVTTTIEGPSVACIPIHVGAKYYFSDNQEGAYAGLMAGIHMLSSEGSDGTTDLSVAPMLGYIVGENIDIGLRYQMIFDKQTTVTYDSNGFPSGTAEESVTNSYLGLRLSYMFGGR